jgi:hypothetical protein
MNGFTTRKPPTMVQRSNRRAYNSYNFIDKDPIIYTTLDLIDRSGLSLAEIERRSGVTRKTIDEWANGKTKRPFHATVRAVFRAVGYDWMIAPLTTSMEEVFTSPPPRPRAERMAAQQPALSGRQKRALRAAQGQTQH